jgi:hypothetical protein
MTGLAARKDKTVEKMQPGNSEKQPACLLLLGCTGRQKSRFSEVLGIGAGCFLAARNSDNSQAWFGV